MYSKITNRNVDPRIIYNEFTRKYENDKEVFDKVISRFDQNGVTLKTREDEIQGGAETGDAQKTVDSMAKRASAKLLSK